MDEHPSRLPPPLPPPAAATPPPLPELESLSCTLTCANCGHGSRDAKQAFCPACGQRTPVHRIDWNFLGKEILQKLLPADRGFVNSMLRLLWRPGHFIGGYIHGQRVGYTKPQVMVTMTTAMLLVCHHYLLGSAPFQEVANASPTDVLASVDQQLTRWVNKNFALFNLLLLPLEALIFRLVFGRMGGYNYPEWMAMTAFFISQSNILWTALLPLQKSDPLAIVFIYAAIITYNVFTFIQIFNTHSRWKVLLRTLGSHALFLLAYILLISAIAIVATIVLSQPYPPQP